MSGQSRFAARPNQRYGFSTSGTYDAFRSGHTPLVLAPEVTNPSDGQDGVGETPTVESSGFQVSGGFSDTHASTDWQIATDSGFTNIVFESLNDTVNLVLIVVPALTLTVSTTFFVRCRHHGTKYGRGGFSKAISFTTALSFV